MGYWKWLWNNRDKIINRNLCIFVEIMVVTLVVIFATVFVLDRLFNNDVITLIGGICIDMPLVTSWIIYNIEEKMG